ncbi:triphosphoribosyl-dephospho-CoA synthase [Lacipirellula limnantheis]|uniref:ATP:dephospho-CoA triphosphoribosyl transferase n=1 Tax=Lacipirellula limnantheis TaxID=2528024 RepID=A0A517TUC9_9BACT|nr:triphosphoribosyl-dephospho-CoA synthase [Lacipirellula limnantheis]QDT71976.1 ATP:dephospho-CoA triphosphoribosyl transferase [Lacipirellula limnantheis]
MTATSRQLAAPPLTLGGCATLACIWEATAAKPGNVYRGADFDDLTYVDFLTSATVIGPIIDRTREQGVGATILAAVAATRAAVATNTNLGMLLLIAPLAAIPNGLPLRENIDSILATLDYADTCAVYEAIPLSQPGGMGEVAEADVHEPPPVGLTLRESMALAADRDLIARQYVNGFLEVFRTADRIEQHVADGQPLGEAIVIAFLELLAAEPDSLIARKAGLDAAQEVSQHAATILDSRRHGDDAFHAVRAEYDFWLRADGHRRNPGTTADVIAAALFALLRENRLACPVKFYGEAANDD